MFSHSHTLKSQKYAHARDCMQYTHSHTQALLFACGVSACPHTHAHTHTEGLHTHTRYVNNKTHTGQKERIFRLCHAPRTQQPKCQSVSHLCLLLLYIHSHIRADGFSSTASCHNVKARSLCNATYGGKKPRGDFLKGRRTTVEMNTALKKELNSGCNVNHRLSTFFSFDVALHCGENAPLSLGALHLHLFHLSSPAFPLRPPFLSSHKKKNLKMNV